MSLYAVTAVYKDRTNRNIDKVFQNEKEAEKLVATCMENSEQFSLIMYCTISPDLYTKMRFPQKISSEEIFEITERSVDGTTDKSIQKNFSLARARFEKALQSMSNTFVALLSKTIFANQDGCWVTLYSREIKHKEDL